ASSADVRSEIIKQNTSLLDEQFFALFSRLLQGAMASSQQPVAQQMADLQKQLLAETEFGRGLQESVRELETASKALQEEGQGLTREKLLDLVIAAPNDARLRAYVSLARNGMDYSFFQLLSDRIDKASGDEKTRLEASRAKLLEFSDEIDRQVEARYKQAREMVEKLLAAEDVAGATRDNLDAFTQDAVDIVQIMLREASDKNDYTRMGKLQKMVQVLQEASAPPPEVAFIEQLLDAPDDAGIEKMLADNGAMVNDGFMEALNGLVAQMESASNQGSAEATALKDKLSQVYKVALKFSMKKNMG
ncbi:MAG TPA: hypothetical protein VIU39_10845, partial [Anaerolineales bacterium]